MSDFDRAEESRERNEGLYYEEYRDRIREGFGDLGWCPKCSSERIAYLDNCVVCGTPLERLGTGDDEPYPEDEEDDDDDG